MSLRVGIVGTGDPNVGLNPEEVTHEGFSVAYRHAPCYRDLAETELVGCADLVEENRTIFAETFDIPEAHAFADYVEMVEVLDIDFVDICTPVSTHADIAIGCAEAGVRAVHTEKPMAHTWGAARRMAEVCAAHDVQLTVNHQRRFGDPFRDAASLLDDGEIGRLRRMEIAPGSLFSYGSHSIDLCGMFNDERPADWVIGQIDYREENVFSSDAHNENQVVAQWQYDNGVYGLACSGPGGRMVNAHHRLVGANGVIEVGARSGRAPVRIRRAGESTWTDRDAGSHGLGGWGDEYPYMIRAIGDAVAALLDGHESELAAANALHTAELIFGTYESARRRGRVDLPLEIEDNPLTAMVDSGALRPEPGTEE